ncbi:hypothetical protein QAD02_017160 [Eretmocerus hayati]|uniref:Uncharacterized protein n=1 Tax=Eretmocerus hayati TaxID=131215 RepID=A0ACC2PE67_9HYME|nr:hypothetical protein QAD02_017160 [Eretmocerus hayati]
MSEGVTDTPLQVARLDGYSDASGNNLVIVPDLWIQDADDEEDGVFFKVKYMSPSGDRVDDSAIREFVEFPLPEAPKDWPEYVCHPQAVARNYNEGLLILNSLKRVDEMQAAIGKSKVRRPRKKKVALFDQTNASACNDNVDMRKVEMDLRSFPNMDVYVSDGVDDQHGNVIVEDAQPTAVNNDSDKYSGDSQCGGQEIISNNQNGVAVMNTQADLVTNYGCTEENADDVLEVSSNNNVTNTKPSRQYKRKAGKDDKDGSSDDEMYCNKGENFFFEFVPAQDIRLILMSFPDFQKFVVKKLKSLDRTQKAMKSELSNMSVAINDTKTAVVEQCRAADLVEMLTFKELCDQSSLDLPLKDLEDFKKFNAALTDPKQSELKMNVVKFLNSNICTTGKLENNIRVILRKFLSKAAAFKVTAKKEMKEKLVLNETELGRILKDCFVKCYNDPNVLDEGKFLTSVGNILNNVKDWDKGRKSV